MKSHNWANAFKCGACGANFVLRSSLLDHEAKVHRVSMRQTQEPKRCRQCKIEFDVKYYYYQHMKQNHELYGCEMCDDLFKSEALLNDHLKKCSVMAASGKACDAYFSSSGNVRKTIELLRH